MGHLIAAETEKSLELQADMKPTAGQCAWLTGPHGGSSTRNKNRAETAYSNGRMASEEGTQDTTKNERETDEAEV